MDAEIIDLATFRKDHQKSASKSNAQIKAEIDAMVAFGMDDELQEVDLKAVWHSPEPK